MPTDGEHWQRQQVKAAEKKKEKEDFKIRVKKNGTW
jgi:hypothetical protein